jgi:hypothetical protein
MMNKNKLKELVNALDELSDDVKDWDVKMESGLLILDMRDGQECHTVVH